MMLSTGIKKYTSNPILGMLPFLLYVILHATWLPEWLALAIPFGITIICELLLRRYFKSRAYSLNFYIVSVALFATFVFRVFDRNPLGLDNIYLVFCEIIIACLLIFMKIGKTFINARFLRKKNSTEKVLLYEYYNAAAFLQYVFTLHLFLILIYNYFKAVTNPNPIWDIFVFTVLPSFMIVSLFIYEAINLNSLTSKLRREEWLPIITEKGEVTGKVARSISEKMKNKFMHPVVRIALISNGKVFLQERSDKNILSPRKLDYPFEKYIFFKHDINLAVRNAISQMMGYDAEIPVRFLMKYTFENEDTKRLIFLFIATVDDENSIKRTSKIKGKFWTVKQIEEAFPDEIFSECFELEFEYLKNMVLQVSSDTECFQNSPVA